MHFSHFLAALAFTAAGASAGLVKPVVVVKPPVVTQQSITCSGGTAFCCGSNADNNGIAATKCTVWENGVGASCNQVLTCCNNNSGNQGCTSTLITGQILFVKKDGSPCDYKCFK